jgi:hypothetical protein
VHITQQCDLNSISRDKSVDSTLKFAIAVARELQITDNPVVGNSEFVAKNLQIYQDGVLREFDLKLQIGEMIALSLHEFVSVFRHRRLRQIGRLRSDITNQIVSTTNNHMSRPASQKMVRPALFSAKVFLQSAKLKNGNTALMETEKKAQIFSLTREGELFSFQDVACVEISLWLAKQLSDLKIKVDVDTLCTDLRRGWRTDKQLSRVVMAKVRDCQDLGRAFRALVADDVDADSVQFTVVYERKF